jgi:hypothetical protein
MYLFIFHSTHILMDQTDTLCVGTALAGTERDAS